MTKKNHSRSALTDEQINQYKKMTKEELDKLQGMEREQARLFSNHTFSRRFILKPNRPYYTR